MGPPTLVDGQALWRIRARRRDNASMGPPTLVDGQPRVRAFGGRRHQCASMGPPTLVDGQVRALQDARNLLLASMGPPTLVDGQRIASRAIGGRCGRLQWGRRLSSMDRAVFDYGHSRVDGLQ